MFSICSVVEFEFCVIFVCYVLSICIEVKLSVSDFDDYEIGHYYYRSRLGVSGGKAHVTERSTKSFCCHASERGETEGAFLWGTQ